MKYIISKNEQDSPQWLHDRLGKITASNFSKLITTTGKISASAEDLIDRAVSEIITGEIIETYQSDWMLRGKELEQEAFDYFNFTHNLEAKKCGFVQSLDENDKKLNYGCSPDAENFDNDFGVEIKCPLAHTHVKYLSSGKLPKEYLQQVQGGMAITGAKRWFFGSYHPSFPALALWIERDNAYCDAILKALDYADVEINKKVEYIVNLMRNDSKGEF